MKLLISAYACAPNRGSEHAVGWTWITQAHRLGHQVWALVAPNHEDSILRTCQELPELAGITWLFPKVPGWPLKQAIEPGWERTYNLLWQIAATKSARKLHAKVGFDAVHHLTWGGVRAPTFLGLVGAPLIVGPLGGGETSPQSLRDAFHLKARITETLRDLSNHTITLNPLVRHGLTNAVALFTKTPDTAHILTPSMQRKSRNFLELGLESARPSQPQRPPGPPRLLFAGRLLYWKGAHIAIQALAELTRVSPDAQLTIVGKGTEEGRLRAAAVAHGVAGNIRFVPWLPQEKLFEQYQTHDLFVYPSLHDSSGNAVLEALSFGLPVVCLDLGGPAQIVTPDAGAIVLTAGRDSTQLAAAMAAEISRILSSPELLKKLSDGAVGRAAQFALAGRVTRFYKMVERMVTPAAGSVESIPCKAAEVGTFEETSTY
jgi:glycosyltransferase involved in cell wall biosynthesis